MRKGFIIGVIALLMMLTGCTLFENVTKTSQVELKRNFLTTNNDYNKETYTLDEYYSNTLKYTYLIEGETLFVFDDLNREPFKMELSSHLKIKERVEGLYKRYYNRSNLYTFNLFQTISEFYLMYDLELQYTLNNYIPLTIYDEQNQLKGILICNFLDNQCKREDVSIQNADAYTFKSVNNNNLYLMIYNNEQVQYYFIDEELNFNMIYKSNEGRILDFDIYNGDYFLLKHVVDNYHVEMIYFDVSDYDRTKDQMGIKHSIIKMPNAESFISFDSEQQQFYFVDNLNDKIKVYDIDFNEIDVINILGKDYSTFIDEQYLISLDQIRINGTTEIEGTTYLYDYKNHESYEFSSVGTLPYRVFDMSHESSNSKIPIKVDNKLFYSRNLVNSGYFDLDKKEFIELDYPPVNYGGKYFTNKALVFMIPCYDSINQGYLPMKNLCSSIEPKITIYHEDYGFIENLPYTTMYYIDETQYFYLNDLNQLVTYNFSTNDVKIIANVNSSYDVMKIKQNTYIIKIDDNYYKYVDNQLVLWEDVNKITKNN